MANEDIRKRIEENNIKYWEIAYTYGISDSSFSRKLRKELPEDEKQKIFNIIDRILKR